MSDPVIRRVRRSIDETKNRGGMQAGMPKVTIDAGDAERLCIVAEALTTTQAENEALRVANAVLTDRVEELETMVKVFRGCIETGEFPESLSPCHHKIIELVGGRDD